MKALRRQDDPLEDKRAEERMSLDATPEEWGLREPNAVGPTRGAGLHPNHHPESMRKLRRLRKILSSFLIRSGRQAMAAMIGTV